MWSEPIQLNALQRNNFCCFAFLNIVGEVTLRSFLQMVKIEI